MFSRPHYDCHPPCPEHATGDEDETMYEQEDPITSDDILEPRSFIRHPAGDLMEAADDDPDYLMCSECGAIHGHTRLCSTNAKPVTKRLEIAP